MIRKLSIPSSTRYLSEVRNFVRQFLRARNVCKSDVNLIVLAIDEACANCIVHGNKNNLNDKLSLLLESREDELLVKVVDTGENVPILKSIDDNIVSECIDQEKKGGLGLYIMQKVMDDVQFLNEEKENYCLLKKKINFPSPPFQQKMFLD